MIFTYSIKTSAIMFIPRNIQKRAMQYIIASVTGCYVVIPGKSTKLRIDNIIKIKI